MSPSQSSSVPGGGSTQISVAPGLTLGLPSLQSVLPAPGARFVKLLGQPPTAGRPATGQRGVGLAVDKADTAFHAWLQAVYEEVKDKVEAEEVRLLKGE